MMKDEKNPVEKFDEPPIKREFRKACTRVLICFLYTLGIGCFLYDLFISPIFTWYQALTLFLVLFTMGIVMTTYDLGSKKHE